MVDNEPVGIHLRVKVEPRKHLIPHLIGEGLIALLGGLELLMDCHFLAPERPFPQPDGDVLFDIGLTPAIVGIFDLLGLPHSNDLRPVIGVRPAALEIGVILYNNAVAHI